MWPGAAAAARGVSPGCGAHSLFCPGASCGGLPGCGAWDWPGEVTCGCAGAGACVFASPDGGLGLAPGADWPWGALSPAACGCFFSWPEGAAAVGSGLGLSDSVLRYAITSA